MKNKLRTILILFSSHIFCIPANAFFVEGYDVSKSWEKSVIYAPGIFFSKNLETISVDIPLPVVIFLHGAGGIHDQEIRWAEYIKSQGFIVVLPNSFAIPNREMNSDPSTFTPNIGKVPVNSLRPAEAEYAMSKIKEVAWADKSNIFLMGHSEGGMGTFLTKELGFNGVIISGFTCGIPRRIGSGPNTPFLAINWETDHFFERENTPYKQCSDRPFWSVRVKASELILPGNGHGTASSVEARNIVSKFLQENLKQKYIKTFSK